MQSAQISYSSRRAGALPGSVRLLASGSLILAAMYLFGCAGQGSSDGSQAASLSPHSVRTRRATSGTAAIPQQSNDRGATAASAAAIHANELGRVMVLEYHNIEDKRGQFFQPPAQLRSDLQLLYDNGYRTIDIHDYLSGNITTPAGKTPVVLTFDDASRYQFRYNGQGAGKSIDPDSAVGILDSFGKAHPDFGSHATFFVLPEGFSQPADKAEKYRYLITHGYTIGNHTYTHPIMTHLSPARVQEELGKDDTDIHQILPDYTVDILAYPFGTRPKTNNKPDYTYISRGVWQGKPYHIRAAFLVGAEPAPSPYSSKFKPLAIPRVQAIEADLQRWVRYFKTHPKEQFVSDGSPSTVSIPRSLAPYLNREAVGNRSVVEY